MKRSAVDHVDKFYHLFCAFYIGYKPKHIERQEDEAETLENQSYLLHIVAAIEQNVAETWSHMLKLPLENITA